MKKLVVGSTTNRQTVIVADDSSIRSLINEYLPTYTGRLALNGEFIHMDDEILDSKLSDFGDNETMTLIAIAKESGAAQVRVDGGIVKLISSIAHSDLKKIEEYRPELMVDKDADGNETMKVGFKEGQGEFGSFYIQFGETPTLSGRASAVATIPEDVADKKEYIVRKYGKTITFLQKMENKFINETKAEIDSYIADVSESITILED